MMNNWKGKPLDTYLKEELIEIIEILNKRWLDDIKEHSRQFEILRGFKKDK